MYNVKILTKSIIKEYALVHKALFDYTWIKNGLHNRKKNFIAVYKRFIKCVIINMQLVRPSCPIKTSYDIAIKRNRAWNRNGDITEDFTTGEFTGKPKRIPFLIG